MDKEIIILVQEDRFFRWHSILHDAFQKLNIKCSFCFTNQLKSYTFITKNLFKLDAKLYKLNNILAHSNSTNIPAVLKSNLNPSDLILDLTSNYQKDSLAFKLQFFKDGNKGLIEDLLDNYFNLSSFTTINISNAEKQSSYVAFKEKYSVNQHIENILSRIAFLTKTFIEGKSYVASNNLNTRNSFSSLSYLKRIYARYKDPFKSNLWRLSKIVNHPFNFEAINTSTIEISKEIFWADPHLFNKNGNTYIFFEELIFNKMRGELFVSTVLENGNISTPELVLDKEYHLSYPFVFEDNNKTYMIPENARANKVDLYESDVFPLQWKLKKTLLQGPMIYDSTIIKYNNKYWMFASVSLLGEILSNECLYLYYSDSLEGQWESHAMNPIKMGADGSRPGGAIFEHNGKLIRPAQDCRERYGHGLMFYEIEVLDTKTYVEKLVHSIYPKDLKIDGVRGIHTISVLENQFCVDLLF